jgi:hypothetical protein
MSDLNKAMPVILVVGGGLSMLLGFAWLLIIKAFGRCLVWSTVWLCVAICAVVTIVAYFKAGILTKALIDSTVSSFNSVAGTSVTVTLPAKATTASTDMKMQWSYFAYAMTAFTVILFFIVLWVRKSIAIAIGIMEEASGAKPCLPCRSVPCLLAACLPTTATFSSLVLLLLQLLFEPCSPCCCTQRSQFACSRCLLCTGSW